MKIMAASIGLGVGLLAASPAAAGPCGSEITAVIQTLTQAWTSSHSAAPSASHMPRSPASAGSLPANPLQPIQPPKIAGAGTIARAPSTAGTLPPNPLEAIGGNKSADIGTMAGGDAAVALQHAWELDHAGQEAACMVEIAKAKALLGIQ